MDRLKLLELGKALTAVVLASAAAFALWAWLGREIPLPDAPGGKLQCLSYTPYREGQSPFDKEFVAPRAQIEEDLTRLAAATHCVRTYSSAQGLDAVAEIAPAHGLDVLLGIWIGRHAKDNAREIEAALAAAQAHPAAIRALVVGNETLLRRELTAAQLIEHIEKVRARTTVPLTYADVWEFWLQNPQVAEHVDFITVHILPYWEDLPVSIEASLAHVQEVLDKVKATFPGKRILVGETGWPSEGRSREGAMPSRVNQARFVREFVQLAQRNDVRYNLIEAFDQPWKRKLEGTVGGYWGLFSEQRNAKWPLVGPVSEYPHWPAAALLASATALGLVVWGLLRGLELSLARWASLALVGAALGCLLVLQLRLAVGASKHFPEWAFYLTLIFASGVAWLTLGLKAAAPFSGWATATPAPLEDVRAWLRSPRFDDLDVPLLLGLVRGVLLFAAAAIAVSLVFDARYRDFPIAIFAPAAIAFLARGRAAAGPVAETRMERALATVILVCAPVGLAVENGVNVEAIAWAITLMLIAWPWRPRFAPSRS
jgi:glucan 1,3-beta-glucosidase